MQIKTVIESLPEITGSEENAEVKYIRLDQIGGSYYIDGNRIKEYPYYMMVISGALRDKYAEETISEVKEFLTLLGQRISIIGGVADNTDIFKILEIGNMLPNYSKTKNLAPIVNNGKNIIFETSGVINYTYTTEFDCLIHITARATEPNSAIGVYILDENDNIVYWNEQQRRGAVAPIVLDFWAKKGTKFQIYGYNCNGKWNNMYDQNFVAIPLE